MAIGWRSQEQAHQLDKRTAVKPDGGRKESPNAPEGLPDRFFNEEGDLDLRNVKGEDMLKYFNSQSTGGPFEE